MGHKKRNLAPRSKQSSPAAGPQSTGDGVADIATPNLSESDLSLIANAFPNQVKIEPVFLWSDGSAYSMIKLECERALNALRRGNHTKAFRLMKELCAKHECSAHSALIHRVHGTVCVKVAQIIDDPSAKQRHLRNAIESVRKAVELSPNSIEFAHFYANLLYEAANDAKEYEEVVQECERALSIVNPIDPAKESLQGESQQKISSAEARIAHVQNELRQLIQKSNVASLSTWMKNLGNGEEKFRLIPIRRPTEDPMEVRLIQTRRPNEIKKATKTPEERRKEIEVRVAAARLLQQKSESNQSQNEGGICDKGADSSSGSCQRVGDKRRYGVRKNGSNLERKDWVWSYWNSLSVDMKKDLIRVRADDLRSHFGPSKDNFASEVLSEALSFAEANKTWKFWACCRCNQKHYDKESHVHHVIQVHMGMLLPKLQSLVPQNVESGWVEMLLNHSFKPLNLSAATKMVENQEKRKGSKFSEDSYSDHHNKDCRDCFRDAWDSHPEKGTMGHFSDNCSMQNNGYTEIHDSDCRECPEDLSSLPNLLDDGWPVSDDSERAKLLEKIHGTFEVLIRHKVFAASHLNKVIQLAMDELQTHPSASMLLNHGLDQSPLCICFLGAEQLKKIHKYLQELSHACGLGRYSEKGISLTEDLNLTTRGPEMKEKIVLSEDALFLVLDEGLALLGPCMSQGTIASDVTSATSSFKASSGSDALLSWIFAGSSGDEQLASWMRAKEDKMHQGVETLQMLEKEFHHLQSLCEKKCERMNYEEGLQAVEDLCVEEGKRREMVTEFAHRSFESVLRKRREELIESENDMLYVRTRFELDAISNVLQEAEAMNVNQFGYEESYSATTSQFYDLESGEEEDWRAKDYMHQMDISIGTAIQKQKEHLSLELCRIDARIMRSMNGMKHLELKLEPVSAYDYQTVILPLLKSFLRTRLEDLAEKDATQKSDAAREAFLVELALDSKKVLRSRNGHPRHMQEKSKDKKKNKDQKKIRDSKVMSGQEQTENNSDSPNSFSLPAVPTAECPDSTTFISTDASQSEELDEETRRKIELEEEEKKLEETLELQRRIETEAKQKHLAEQNKKFSQTHSDNETNLHDALSKPSADCLEVREPLKHSRMVEQLVENGFSYIQGHVNNNTTNGSIMSIKCAVDSGIPNGGVPDAGLLLADRRSGKRSRRHKSTSKLVDGKFELVPSGNKNILCQRTHGDGHLQEQVVEENGMKTLRELQVEDDEEERFQADIKRAVRQSLDTYQAHQKLPLVTRPQTHPRTSGDEVGFSTEQDKGEITNEEDVLGMGLKNEVGEYNCFLNVIIQSLWHLQQFRNEFLRSTTRHVHVGDPCVVCALYEVFAAMSNASKELRREAIAPTSLRIALSNLYPDSNFFQEAQMNDASEVLAVIFDCLHQSFTSSSSVSDTDSVESTCTGSWDCSSDSCIVHSLFGMNIYERMNCYHCGLESRHLKYTSFFHNINASALRTMKVMCGDNNLDELLNLVEMNHQLACDPEAGGCGKLNYIHHFLPKPPHVFTTVLGWQNTCESFEDITATLAALGTKIDISILYRGLDPKSTHNLISVVCYYGQHYHCFAYCHDNERWVMYDDKTVKVIGGWAEVLTMCEKGHLQPQVLLFESVE